MFELCAHKEGFTRSNSRVAKSTGGGRRENSGDSRGSSNKSSGRNQRRNRRSTRFGLLETTLGWMVNNPLTGIDEMKAAGAFRMMNTPVK